MTPVRACSPELTLLSGAWRGAGGLPPWLLSGMSFAPSARYALGRALELVACEPGDEILVPRIHCIAVIAPLRYLGLVPVFYDLDEHFNPIMESVQSGVTARTRAVVFIHYFGKRAITAPLSETLQAAGLAVIWDCAHAWLTMLADEAAPQHVDFIIASTMKFQATSDGGILWSAPAQRNAKNNLRRRYKNEFRAAISLAKCVFIPPSAPPAAKPAPTVNASASPLTVDAASYAPDKHRAPCTFAAQRVTLGTDWLTVSAKRTSHYNRLREIIAPRFPEALAVAEAASADFVPYVFPLIVSAEHAQSVHHALRAEGIQSQRWDVFDPLLSAIDERTARILMLPCHESLRTQDIVDLAANVLLQLERLDAGTYVHNSSQA